MGGECCNSLGKPQVGWVLLFALLPTFDCRATVKMLPDRKRSHPPGSAGVSPAERQPRWPRSQDKAGGRERLPLMPLPQDYANVAQLFLLSKSRSTTGHIRHCVIKAKLV